MSFEFYLNLQKQKNHVWVNDGVFFFVVVRCLLHYLYLRARYSVPLFDWFFFSFSKIISVGFHRFWKCVHLNDRQERILWSENFCKGTMVFVATSKLFFCKFELFEHLGYNYGIFHRSKRTFWSEESTESYLVAR